MPRFNVTIERVSKESELQVIEVEARTKKEAVDAVNSMIGIGRVPARWDDPCIFEVDVFVQGVELAQEEQLELFPELSRDNC